MIGTKSKKSYVLFCVILAEFLIYSMEKRKFTYAEPRIIEEKRIKEIRNLSYLERLNRLFAILESSRIFKTGKITRKS